MRRLNLLIFGLLLAGSAAAGRYAVLAGGSGSSAIKAASGAAGRVEALAGIRAPYGLAVTCQSSYSITGSWGYTYGPTPTSYTLQLSTASDFTGTLASSTTLRTSATISSGLTAGSVYYGRAEVLVNVSSSDFSVPASTATNPTFSIDAVSHNELAASDVALNDTHTVGSFANYLLAALVIRNSNNQVPGTPTYNGTNMVFISSNDPGGFESIYLYGLKSPSTGTNTLATTISPTGTYGIVAYSFNSETSTGTVTRSFDNTSTVTSSTQTVSSATGEIVVDFLARVTGGSDLPTVNAADGQTSRVNAAVGTTDMQSCSSSNAGASSTKMNWYWTNGSREAHMAIAVQP